MAQRRPGESLCVFSLSVSPRLLPLPSWVLEGAGLSPRMPLEGEKVVRVCAVDGGQGSCRPQRAPGGVARLGLTHLLGSLLHGGLGRGQGLHLCSTRDSGCFAKGRQGGSIHSQLTTPGDLVLGWRRTRPGRPAGHQAGPPGTRGTRTPRAWSGRRRRAACALGFGRSAATRTGGRRDLMGFGSVSSQLPPAASG